MQTAITHISTACVLLELGPVRILTDPVFDTGRKTYNFAGPLIRATRSRGPAVAPGDLPPLDAILLSHPHHLDNLDGSGRALLPGASKVITGKHGRRHLGDLAVGLDCWETTTVFGRGGEEIKVTATPALHGPWWFPGTRHVCGFVLEWEGGRDGGIYLSGDTIMFRGIAEIAGRFPKIDTAILNLGAVHFWPPLPKCIRFTFNAEEAAQAATSLGAGRVIPVHYEQSTWSHFKQDVATYVRTFQRHGLSDRVLWLTRGERTPLPPPA